MFPQNRPRRLRQNATLRDMVKETSLELRDLIQPFFVTNGTKIKNEIVSMPEIFQISPDIAVKEVEDLLKLGIKSIILFGIPQYKDEIGTSAYDSEEAVQVAVREIKKRFPEMLVITDVCLCEYTSHGHCGLIEDNKILNDPTLNLLGRIAISHAEAGADVVAPSDMMDGRVAAIRENLDISGFDQIPIMSYAVKYSSAFYGPFRDAAGSAPQFGDRNTYQMDPGNVREAIKEVREDMQEGADIVIVKPALSYLDIIKAVKEETNCPVAAYNVSGEYSMIKAAVQKGWLDEKRVVTEKLLSMKRAGADLILTYHAKEVASWMKED